MTDVVVNLRVLPHYSGVKVLDGAPYKLTVKWNGYSEKWYLDIKGLSNSVDIKGIALLPGKDLLGPYGFYELGELWMTDESGAKENPTYDDIGSRFVLTYTSRS